MQSRHLGLNSGLGARRSAEPGETGSHSQVKRGRWGSKRAKSPDSGASAQAASPATPTESAAYLAVTIPAVPERNRFRAPNLAPVQVQARRSKTEPAGTGGSGRGRWFRPVRLFDWALLLLEVASALMVAWILGQYIYTVYFDTAPRRVTPAQVATPSHVAGIATSAAITLTATPTVLVATPSPTLFSEVAPPETGPGPEGTPGATETPTETATATATPTATPTVDPQLLLPKRLRIPVMFLDSPVEEVQVDMGMWQVSPMQIGHHEGSGNPGEVGNVVLAGHRDINSALFRELDRLKPGDEIFVSNSFKEYRYVVRETTVVMPNATEVMDPTTDKRVTLITCTPVGIDTQRLVVVATLDETQN